MILDFKKIAEPEQSKIKAELLSDLKIISEDSKNLKDVDPQRSSVEFANDQINFNLVYYAVHQSAFTASGFIKKEDKILEISFNYEFEKETFEGGVNSCPNYFFALHIKAEYDDSPSRIERIEKEEILQYIRKTVDRIFERFNNGEKTLSAVTLNQDDVEALAVLDSGEISRMVQTLIGAVISFAKFKEMNNPNNHKIGISLRSAGGKRIINDFSIKKINSFSAEIKENKTGSVEKLNTMFL